MNTLHTKALTNAITLSCADNFSHVLDITTPYLVEK